MDTQPPAGVQFGYVVFAAIKLIADSMDDPDRLPDARPAEGMRVSFSPKLRRMVIPGGPGGQSVLVEREPQEAEIDGNGVMVDANREPGVWVVAGSHSVEIVSKNGSRIPIEIEVTPAYTVDDPLDLASFIPPEPALDPLPGVPLVGLTVTQAQYDALPGYDPSTVYFVIGAA